MSDAPNASLKADILGNSYSVYMSRLGDSRVYTIIPDKYENRGNFDELSLLNESIKTPLAMISTAANSMLPLVEGSGSESLSKNLSIIYKNYYKLLRLSNALSGFYEMHTNSIKLNLQNIDLLSLCRNLVDTVALLTKERGVRIWFKSGLDQAVTAADFDKSEYVLLNIIANCLKHTVTGDDITVALSRSPDFFIVTVSVISESMPEQLLGKVFEPKYHSRFLGNTGIEYSLDFAYSAKIIELHGGSMIMESRAGHSTTLKFTLPIKTAEGTSYPPKRYGEGGMMPILTELSDLLSIDCYDAKYMD